VEAFFFRAQVQVSQELARRARLPLQSFEAGVGGLDGCKLFEVAVRQAAHHQRLVALGRAKREQQVVAAAQGSLFAHEGGFAAAVPVEQAEILAAIQAAEGQPPR
jgi:hypothetical protein